MVRVAMNGMTEKDLEGNSNRPLPGMYHVMIDTVREMPDDNYVQLDFSVLAGTPEGQEGKKLSQRFYIAGKDDDATKKCLSRLARVAVEMGLMTRADIGKNLDIDFSAAECRDCVIKVKESKYTDKNGEKKTGVEMDFLGIWSTDHEEVQQVPKDPSFARNNASSTAPPQLATVGSSANGAGSRDFDDI